MSTFVDEIISTMIEILTISLKTGMRAKFHQLYISKSLPLQQKWNINVMGYGPSLHDADSYYTIRVFKSIEERQNTEDAFYGSEEWKKGPGAEMLSLIENVSTVVISSETFNGWAGMIK
jgi:hypothetical protein